LLLFWGSCGARSGYSILEVGDAPSHVSPCGFVMTYALAPLVTSVGGQVTLHATVQAPDGGAASAALVWDSPRGRVSAPTPDAIFSCLVGGHQAVNLLASTKSCTDKLTFSVYCLPPACGDGQVDPGEQCDPPNGATCLDGCALPCGNGLIDGSEPCDPPDGVTCSATCRKLR
jgi:hypothetical protein